MALVKEHRTRFEKRLKEINAQLKMPKNRNNQKVKADLNDEKERCE